MFTRTCTCPFDRQVLRVILRFINLSRAILKVYVNQLCQESPLKHMAKQSTHTRYLTITQGDIDLSIIYASSCKQSSIEKYMKDNLFLALFLYRPEQHSNSCLTVSSLWALDERAFGTDIFSRCDMWSCEWVWCVREIALIVSWLRNLMPSDFWAKRTGLLQIREGTV